METDPVDLLITEPAPMEAGQGPVACLVLAHGAGAAMDTDFMNAIADQVAAQGIRVVRFEFPYMVRRGQDGSRRPPDRQPVLLACWQSVIRAVRERFDPRPLVIGGKSMGGRMASLIADDEHVDGLVALGFPFHAAGKPEGMEKRIAHLATLQTPMLICQGTRDALGSRETIRQVPLAPTIDVRWMEDGDHSLKPRKASGRTESQALTEAALAIGAFVKGLPLS